MVGKGIVKCAKCGISSNKENFSLTFHRFPLPSVHGSLKARVWAKFCFPDDDWTSDESLVKLYKQHKMLCGNHFDDTSFTSSAKSRLNKFAIPTEAQNILAQLRNEHLPREAQETQYQETALQMDNMQVTASTSQCSRSIEHSVEHNLQGTDLTKDELQKTRASAPKRLPDKRIPDKILPVFCPKCNTEVEHTGKGIQEGETKAVIAKVYHYFEQEFEELKKMYPDVDLTPLSRFLHRTAVATGVSRTTVQDILKEEQAQSTVFEESCQRQRKASKRRRGSDSTIDEDSSLASDHGDEHPDDADVTDDGDQVENSENEEASPTATVSSEKQVEPPDDKEDLHQSPSSQSELHFGPTTVKIEPLDYEENMTQTELIFDPLSMTVERRDDEENKGGQDATVEKMKIENNEEGFS